VSHLVALSGFHLGILWAVLYGVLLLLYRPLQQRYFPWRYALKDVGLMVVVMLGGYLWLTGAPPSLLRSYAMLLVGWTMVLMGIDLLSFTFLTTITFLLLALFPPLIASLGFWLSIAGVFYIFLLLHYCHAAHKWVISLLCIPVGIFVLMQPLVHGIFPLTSQGQLLSPLLSIGFIVFYPLAFVLHMIGHGGVLDGLLTSLFALPATSEEHWLPVWAVASYLVLSVGAIWRRELFGVLVVVAMGYGIYLFGY
jgi:competence protein ComEC